MRKQRLTVAVTKRKPHRLELGSKANNLGSKDLD